MITSEQRASRGAHVGRMTAAMRAATVPNAPRVLRMARVVGGRIVEERIFASRERVTIDGRPFDMTSVQFDDKGRAKVVLGGTTLLFQLVIAPPKPSRAQLPRSLTQRSIDWPLTILAALSFLFHFGVVGATFSDWLDPIVDEGGGGAVKLVDTSAPSAPQVEDQAGAPSGAVARPSAVHATAVTRPSRARSEASHAASLAREAEAMQLSILGTFTGGPSVEAALRRSEIPTPDLTQVARDPRGAEATGRELTLSTGGAPTGPSHKLGDYGDDHGGALERGRQRDPSGPRVDVTITPPEPPPGGGDVFGPAIARLRPSFRSCYVHKGLDVDPSMEGKVTIEIDVAPNGDVSRVSRVSGEGLSAAVEACIMQRAQNGSFPAPGGSGARGRVPIVFRRQP